MTFEEIVLVREQVVPSGHDSAILPARVVNYNAGLIWFILPALGASRIMKDVSQTSSVIEGCPIRTISGSLF